MKRRLLPMETYGVSGKVGLIYIHRRCPNFEIGSLFGRNL